MQAGKHFIKRFNRVKVGKNKYNLQEMRFIASKAFEIWASPSVHDVVVCILAKSDAGLMTKDPNNRYLGPRHLTGCTKTGGISWLVFQYSTCIHGHVRQLTDDFKRYHFIA